jgi:phosphoribosylformimino-5-aminoimidazole carboxamide ribotide isomerase
MRIFPAIDLYGKKAVRLYKGDYSNMTVYNDDPLSVARDFERQGASHVHLVDLEGAKLGTTPNIDIIESIAKNTTLFVEVGGGIRSEDVLDRYFAAGVSRCILGTAAVSDADFLSSAVKKYGEKIAVSADVKDGYVAIKGWVEKSEYTLDAFLEMLEAVGVKTVILTDVSKDGAMRGTNLELYRQVNEKYGIDFIASGGVSSMDDVRALAKLGIYGAIIGKAYYVGAIDISLAVKESEI